MLTFLLGLGLASCSSDDTPAASESASTPPSAPATRTTSAAATPEPTCPSPAVNPPSETGRAAVDGASLPVRDGWTIRGDVAGWKGFGPGASELAGANLLRPTCVLDTDRKFVSLPRDVEAWLLGRKDFRAQVVERMKVDGHRGVLVKLTPAADVPIWCFNYNPNECFRDGQAYAVFPLPDGPVVVEGFGRSREEMIRTTRALALQLRFE